MNLSDLISFKISIPRKNKICALVCFLSYLPCQAEIVIRAAGTPSDQYAAWITTHPNDQSWITHLEKQHPSKTESAKLMDLIEIAQKAFLTGSLNDAKDKFRELADLSLTNDWGKAERKAITYAMLRLVQLQTMPKIGEGEQTQVLYLRSAARFGFDVHFDAKIFPPPLIKRWQNEIRIARRNSVKIFNLKDLNSFDIIKIDGRAYSLHDIDNLIILPGEHRLSLLANHAQYFTRKVNSSQLQVIKIQPEILVYGSCSQPQAQINFAFTAVFDDACVRQYNGMNWIAKLIPKLEQLDLQASNYKSTQAQFSTAPQASETPHSKKWIWIGAGAAVLASLALVYKNNQNKFFGAGDQSEAPVTLTPSHHEGN